MPTAMETHHDKTLSFSSTKVRKINKSFSTGSILADINNNNNKCKNDINDKNTKPAISRDISHQDFNSTKSTHSDNLNLTSIKPKIKSQTFEDSLISMHKFLKENNIYALNKNSTGNLEASSKLYNYRTVYLTRNAFGASTYNPKNGNEFGFNLQTYGLLNSTTKQTEYICFVNNVQPRSSAKRAGLTNGDILLAVDTIRIDRFKAFADIVKHVKGKNELCLVIFPEKVCKRVQYQQRIAQIEKILSEKRLALNKLLSDEDNLLIKYKKTSSSATATGSEPMQSSLTSSNSFCSQSSGSLSIKSSSNIAVAEFISPIPATANNNNSFMSGNNNNVTYSLISSGLGSESTNSVSNSSSFSAGKKQQLHIKNSTPIEPHQLATSSNNTMTISMSSTTQSDSAYVSGELDRTGEHLSQKQEQEQEQQPPPPLHIVKVVKNDEDSASTTSLSTHGSGSSGAVKSKSMAKKCLEKTNRLIRSASTSSMNLISRMNPLSFSTNNLAKTATAASTDETAEPAKTLPAVAVYLDVSQLALKAKEKNKPKIVKVKSPVFFLHCSFQFLFAKKKQTFFFLYFFFSQSKCQVSLWLCCYRPLKKNVGDLLSKKLNSQKLTKVSVYIFIYKKKIFSETFKK